MDFSKFLFNCTDIVALVSEPHSNKRPVITSKYELINEKPKESWTAAEKKYMAEKQDKIDTFKPSVSKTLKTNIAAIYSREIFGRWPVNDKSSVESLQKGSLVEVEAIEMASEVLDISLKKNYELFANNSFKGRPDCIKRAKTKAKRKVYDIKCPIDLPSFIRQVTDALDRQIYCQMQGYMDITNTDEAGVIFCLVNMPQQIIDTARRRIIIKGREFDHPHEMIEEKIAQMERNMIYDDIPMQMRVFEVPATRDAELLMHAKEKVELARDYLSILHNKLQRNA